MVESPNNFSKFWDAIISEVTGDESWRNTYRGIRLIRYTSIQQAYAKSINDMFWEILSVVKKKLIDLPNLTLRLKGGCAPLKPLWWGQIRHLLAVELHLSEINISTVIWGGLWGLRRGLKSLLKCLFLKGATGNLFCNLFVWHIAYWLGALRAKNN